MSDLIHRIRHWSYHLQCIGKQGTSLEQVLKNVIAVYSAHPTAPLSLFARTKSFTEPSFYQLDQNKLALRLPAMRLSAFMLPKETAHFAFAATIPPATDPVWEKRYSQKGRIISKNDYELWKKQILNITKIPLTLKEIKLSTSVPEEKLKLVLNRMGFEGILLRVGAKSLRSNVISYVSTKAWMGENFPPVDQYKALTWLAGEYLRAFGPVRIKDFQWWAGITAGKAESVFATHDVVDIGDGNFLLAKELGKFESFKIPTKDTVDILPQWDCYTMGYAPDGRERFVSKDVQSKIYGQLGATGGNALGTILVNGFAHGSWSSRFKGNHMIITINMFDKPNGKLNHDIGTQFNKIAMLFMVKNMDLIYE